MNEQEEAAYMLGRKAVLREQLSAALRGLGVDEDISREVLIDERAAAIATLREICEEHGDNDWPDDLHLVDILTKHLADYLEE